MVDGDALSRLIQLHANRHGIRINWSGEGVKDLDSLCNVHAANARTSKHMWTGMQEMSQMLDGLPEALQVKVASIILKSRALNEIESEDHAKRMALVASARKPGAA
jgi:hypothetical protein